MTQDRNIKEAAGNVVLHWCFDLTHFSARLYLIQVYRTGETYEHGTMCLYWQTTIDRNPVVMRTTQKTGKNVLHMRMWHNLYEAVTINVSGGADKFKSNEPNRTHHLSIDACKIGNMLCLRLFALHTDSVFGHSSLSKHNLCRHFWQYEIRVKGYAVLSCP